MIRCLSWQWCFGASHLLYLVGVQCVHRRAVQYGFVYVLGVYVQVEQGEGAQHDVSDDQPPDRELEDGVDALRSPVDGYHVGVSHDYFRFS